MARKAAQDELGFRIDQVRQTAVTVNREEVAQVVDEVVKSLSGAISLAEIKLYQELDVLAKVIQAAKREICQVRPDDISAQHIPDATNELDAVVQATAEATGEILDCAEAFEQLAGKLPKDAGTKVTALVTRIYEACNFQDITGQRISKVVKTLNYIEGKIDAILVAFGDQLAGIPLPDAPQTEGDEALLHGPQLPKNANTQAEIDALLADLF